MKKRTRQNLCRFQLKVLKYCDCDYLEQIAKLERALARRPRTLRLEIAGAGELPADFALQIRSVIQVRSAATKIITVARSSLQGSSVLVWLLGDHRIIREDAKLYFRQTTLPERAEADPNAPSKDPDTVYSDSEIEVDPEEGDYARAIQLINEYLPVRELAGRLVGLPILKQFGLVENEQVDDFLTAAFGRKPAIETGPERELSRSKRPPDRAKKVKAPRKLSERRK